MNLSFDSTLYKIKQIIDDRFLSENQINLEERFGKKKIMTRKIIANNSYLLYKFDNNQLIFPFFNQKIKHLNSMCDYILFYESEAKLYCFLIELKYGGDSSSVQLKCGHKLVNFIILSSKRTTDFKIELNDVEFKKIRIKECNSSKIIKKTIKENGKFFEEANRNNDFCIQWKHSKNLVIQQLL